MKITKLSLKRETLRELNGRELDAVAGGIEAGTGALKRFGQSGIGGEAGRNRT